MNASAFKSSEYGPLTPAKRSDVIAWLMTLANIHGVDLEKALTKYTDPKRVEGVKP